MEISKIKLTDINPADYNPRVMSESARKKLRNSIETFGLVDPIIINLKNNRIIGGHQRYNVLLDMVMESDNLAEKEFDFLKKDDYGFIFDSEKLVIENEDYEKALNIVLNNTNLTGDYDYPKLESLLSDLEFNGFDLEFTGFDNADFEEMEFDFHNNDDVPMDVVEDDFEVSDELETDIQRGDLFKLGNHYLLCGDATLEEDVMQLISASGEREH